MFKKHAGLQHLGQQAVMLADVHSPNTSEQHWQLRCVGRGRPSGGIRSSPWMTPLVWKPLRSKPMPKKALKKTPPSKPSLQQVGQPISTEACEGNWRQRIRTQQLEAFRASDAGRFGQQALAGALVLPSRCPLGSQAIFVHRWICLRFCAGYSYCSRARLECCCAKRHEEPPRAGFESGVDEDEASKHELPRLFGCSAR